MAMIRYRMYIDESGDHTYSQLDDPSRRYLSLTGTVVESQYYRSVFHPRLESLKQNHFPYNPDDPVVLVRSRIIQHSGLFRVLEDPAKNQAWEKAFLDFIAQTNFNVLTVTIDKKAHLQRYQSSAYHPYHYCMAVLLERYLGLLKHSGGHGDVLAESRGKVEDSKLKQVYQSIWQDGTWYRSGREFQTVLTSKELKLKKKEHNIAGLQLADLIAAPSKIDVLIGNGIPVLPQPGRFTTRLIQALRHKYSPYGKVFLG